MKALLLAAGIGSRLGALTAHRPKPMLPILGRPLLEYTVGLLRAHGVREIAINLHHHARVVKDHFGDGRAFGVRIEYSHEDQLLGTAGAAKKLDYFLTEPFFVIYGDILTDLDLSSLARRHEETRSVLTLALYKVEDPTRAGIVDVDPTGRVHRFLEKPKPSEIFSELANAGIYVVDPSVLGYLPAGVQRDFGHHLIPELLVRDERVFACRADGYILDIGGPERYAQAGADIRAGLVRVYSARDTAASSCPIVGTPTRATD